MKIYILRHEDRTEDCSFFAPLTEDGLNNSIKLISALNENNIDMIYSSPFIRTLQTIYPYAKTNDIKINVEYGLSEIHHNDIIPKKAVGMHLPEYIAKAFNYDDTYKTIIGATEIEYPETDITFIKKRVKRVLKSVIENNCMTDNNIVLVTHMSLCSFILTLVNKFKNKIDTKVIDNYEKGNLCLVFNGDWTYKPINF